MSKIVLPPKYVGERKRYNIDFTSQLQQGETLVSATVLVTVYSGLDATPSAMLRGNPFIFGPRVYQTLQEGEPGVVYFLTVTATTSTGELLTIDAFLAVLDPDTDVADPECCTRIGNASAADNQNFTINFLLNPVPNYRHGLPLFVIFDDALEADNPTIDVDGLGVKKILLTENITIRQYEILDDDVLHLVYDEDADTGNGAFILMNKIGTQFALFVATDQSSVFDTGEKFNYPGMPSMMILGLWAGLKTAGTTDSVFDVNADGSSMLSTKITVDANEKSSKTSGTPPVFSSRTFTGPWILSGDVDTAGTNAAGWNILMKYRALE